MGLFKKIKKAVKKVFKGIKKVFKKVGKFVGKIAKSKWGKALMIAGAVTMGGLALYGALQGAAAAPAGTSFLGKFAAGAKGALSAITNPVATGKAALGATGQAGTVSEAASLGSALTQPSVAGSSVAAPMEMITSQVAPSAAEAAVASAGGAGGAAGGAGGGFMGQAGGLLSKAGGAVMDFAKSAGGGQLISGAVQGFAEGKAAEEQMRQERKMARYYDKAWRDPEQLAMLQGTVEGYDPSVPGGHLDRARRVNQFLNERQYAYPTGTPSAEEVAGYARSGG